MPRPLPVRVRMLDATTRTLHLNDARMREVWAALPAGVLTLAVDYSRGEVLLVTKGGPGRVSTGSVVAPLSDSGDPEPGAITRGDVLDLFENEDRQP